MWTQIIGKTRLKLAPHLNHWCQVPFYVAATLGRWNREHLERASPS